MDPRKRYAIACLAAALAIAFAIGLYDQRNARRTNDVIKELRSRDVLVAGVGLEYVVLAPNFQGIQSKGKMRHVDGFVPADDAAFLPVAELMLKVGGPSFLDLSESGITDASVALVARMSRLSDLHLRCTQITNASISLLQREKIRDLGLSCCFGITDECIPSLEKMTSLRTLDVSLSRISCAGVERLKESLPGCKIRAVYCDQVSLPNFPIADTCPCYALSQLPVVPPEKPIQGTSDGPD